MKKNMFRIIIISLTLSLLFSPPVLAKKKTTNLRGFIKFVEREMKAWQVVGAAVAIVRDGKVVFARGFGYRDKEKGLKVTADTLFAIGSCSKAFTATLLGILVDEGKLDWDKPVRDYLPVFKLKDPFASQEMTAVDLVTHRSGLPRHDFVWYNSSASRLELINRFQYLDPTFGFRTRYQYNNLMFMTAGYLAGQLCNSTWEKLIQEKIFAPLGMKNCNLSVEDSKKAPDYSLPYSKVKEKISRIPFRNIDAVGPAGSINASVNEIAKWILLNLNKGKVGKKQIISTANLTKIHSPQMVTGGGLSDSKEYTYSTYGMGWGMGTYRGRPVLGHGGGIDGFISNISFLPRDNAGVVVLTNYDGGGGALCSVIRYNVYDRILGKNQIPWSKRIKDRQEKNKKKAEKAKAKKKETRVSGTRLSHGLADYTGTFSNPGYGKITIKKEKDKLVAIFNNLTYIGTHFHYDIFEFVSDTSTDQKLMSTFFTDIKGNISKVAVPFQPGAKDVVFTRVAAEKMKDRKFLEQFVGEYEFSDVSGKVQIRGENTLILTVTGQPSYELLPYKGTEFNIKNLKGYSVKFILDKSGKVTGLESHQPNGVFSAKKKM